MHQLKSQAAAILETDCTVQESPKALIIQGKKKSIRSIPARSKPFKDHAKPTAYPIGEAEQAREEAVEVEDGLHRTQQPSTASCMAKEPATGPNSAHRS
jgi:hypothetical protein